MHFSSKYYDISLIIIITGIINIDIWLSPSEIVKEMNLTFGAQLWKDLIKLLYIESDGSFQRPY